MRFNLDANFTFSSDVSKIKNEIEKTVSFFNDSLLAKDKSIKIFVKNLEKNYLILNIFSEGVFRPHNALLQLKNVLTGQLGKEHKVGIRHIKIIDYFIDFELDKKPLKTFTIPFANLEINEKKIRISLTDVSEEFLQRNYIDRMISLVKEKVENQYYEGKGEFWKLIWESGEKKSIWFKDPTEEMIKLNWVKQGPTKGKWFYYAQATAIMKTMEKIAVEEVLKPLGFQEVIESHIVPFDIWLKTGHLEGMPGEIYYVCEPATRDVEKWERFIDLTKITKTVDFDELQKNISTPTSGICYAQCPVIYWSLKGKTVSEKSLPILVYDKTAISGRYESGGRHGIERVDEFHRIEPVYIGTKQQLLDLREKLIEKYKHVFNNIFDLEWRMAWVTPWYMQQAGKLTETGTQDTGTIDFEAYMPYRGGRKNSQWLEFQNLSILGDKYIKAFNIKSQKSELWSGCSGIGLERWTTVFLAQKGLDPDKWPDGFRRYLKELPKGIEFL
ncbi:MAG: serine--tRNA ligase [Candidatus Thermoplasmatota archaeon]|jgi:seryl-tRNA synthetase|nr:serine--tRNA ligase [Candidatus Thermoplasmatota archaeon]